MSRYQFGIVALVDALGFAGIYRKYDPELVLEQMLSIKHRIGKIFADYQRSNHILLGASMGLRLLSDTVVISLQLPSPKAHDNRSAVILGTFTVCELLLELTAEAAHAKIPLTYRGSITSGHYCAADEFIVGPAIDEAASLYELADGAFIWLAPSLLPYFPFEESTRSANVSLISYQLPLKRGNAVQTLVLDTGRSRKTGPNNWGRTSNEDLQAKQLATFDTTRIDVLTKMQNTKNFFAAASDFRRRCS